MTIVKFRPHRAQRQRAASDGVKPRRQRNGRRFGAAPLWRYPGLALLIVAATVIGVVQVLNIDGAGDGAPMVARPTSITDGDTLRMGAVRIRLQGIDAPELDTPEGVQARSHLVQLVGDTPIACADTGQRSYDRVVAVCRTLSGSDLAQAMVEAGWATDWPRFSGGRYALAQLRARVAKRGMHGMEQDVSGPSRQRPSD